MAKKHRELHKEEIIKLFKEGNNYSTIAKKLGILRYDIEVVLKEQGLYIPKKENNKNNEVFIQKAIGLYREGKTLKEISPLVDIPIKVISKLLKERNIPIREATEYNRKTTVDHNSFSEYTPESVYWAGFIVGDGCIYSRLRTSEENNNMTVTLQLLDEEHLSKLKKFLKYSGKLYYKKDGMAVSLLVNSRQIVKDLEEKYNVTNNKTYDYIPPKNIPKELLKYFILGLIDADGSFLRHKRTHQSENRTRGEYVYQIGFTGTYESCLLVREFFHSSVKIHTRHKERDNNNHTVLFQGNEQVLRYGHKLYDDKTQEFCMKRKFDNYTALKEEYRGVA